MLEVNVQELQSQLTKFITQVSIGEEIAIIQRGEIVARLMPPPPCRRPQLPDLTEFRASIQLRGEGLSETIIKERREARY